MKFERLLFSIFTVKEHTKTDKKKVSDLESIYLSNFENGNNDTTEVCSSPCYQPRNVDFSVCVARHFVQTPQLSHNNLSLTTNSDSLHGTRMSFRNIP